MLALTFPDVSILDLPFGSSFITYSNNVGHGKESEHPVSNVIEKRQQSKLTLPDQHEAR